LNDTLAVSENGLLCNDSDANLNAAGIPAPQVVGVVSAVPSIKNGNRLGVDLNIGPSR
jgi:phosphohistidine swiveling domain-containing protein